jgi:hypothetical protein
MRNAINGRAAKVDQQTLQSEIFNELLACDSLAYLFSCKHTMLALLRIKATTQVSGLAEAIDQVLVSKKKFNDLYEKLISRTYGFHIADEVLDSGQAFLEMLDQKYDNTWLGDDVELKITEQFKHLQVKEDFSESAKRALAHMAFYDNAVWHDATESLTSNSLLPSSQEED